MENQNEKTPKMNTGEGKKKRYYKKRKPKSVVANDVVKAEQGSSSSSPAASDTPTAKPKGKRAYGNKNNDQLGMPKLTAPQGNRDDHKIQTTVNGHTVEHTKTREAIDRAMRISSEMVAQKYAEKDYMKEGASWDNGAHGYTEACAYDDCACGNAACNESGYTDSVDWDGLLDRLEAMNQQIGSQRVTVWDRVKAFAYGILYYDRALMLTLIASLEVRLGNTHWAIAFGCLAITLMVTSTMTVIQNIRLQRLASRLKAYGAEIYKKK